MTPEELDAIRERNRLVVPRFLPVMTSNEYSQVRADMDRRDLLEEVDNLRTALVSADSIMSLIRYRRSHTLTDQDRADLDAAISTCRRLT